MLPGHFAQQVAPLCPQQVAPFCRTLTTTDSQTSLLVESDGCVFDELHDASRTASSYSAVHWKTFVGEERQRVQELRVGFDRGLLEVVGVGLITCGEAELIRQVHTLFVRSAQQVVFELQMREEVAGVRLEVREAKGEIKVEESRSLHERMWMG